MDTVIVTLPCFIAVQSAHGRPLIYRLWADRSSTHLCATRVTRNPDTLSQSAGGDLFTHSLPLDGDFTAAELRALADRLDQATAAAAH